MSPNPGNGQGLKPVQHKKLLVRATLNRHISKGMWIPSGVIWLGAFCIPDTYMGIIIPFFLFLVGAGMVFGIKVVGWIILSFSVVFGVFILWGTGYQKHD